MRRFRCGQVVGNYPYWTVINEFIAKIGGGDHATRTQFTTQPPGRGIKGAIFFRANEGRVQSKKPLACDGVITCRIKDAKKAIFAQ